MKAKELAKKTELSKSEAQRKSEKYASEAREAEYTKANTRLDSDYNKVINYCTAESEKGNSHYSLDLDEIHSLNYSIIAKKLETEGFKLEKFHASIPFDDSNTLIPFLKISW